MKRITRENATGFLHDHSAKPVLTVELGEEFVLETEDAFAGHIRENASLPTEDEVPGLQATPALLNPLVGPIFVEGVERGDLLKINILDIEVDRQGVTCIVPRVGPLEDSHRWQDCNGPYTRVIRHVAGPSGKMADGKGWLDERVSWDLHAFIGTVGTAPEREIESSLTGQGPWGGNMDCRDVAVGSSLYLNAYHDGGLMFVGDAHASQADTEFYGIADECRAEIRLSCDVVKSKRIPNPRIDKPDSVICVCSAKPLEEAVGRAMMDMFEMMVEDYGVPAREAYLHLGINPDLRVHVYQMIRLGRLQYTVGVELPRRYLEAYGS